MQNPKSNPETTLMEWIESERAATEAEVRRLAKRDGIPPEAVEALLAKLRGERTPPTEAELDELLGKPGPAIEVDPDQLAAAVALQRAEAQSRNHLAPIEAQADIWAERINLIALIENATSPTRLNKNVPDDVRQDFYKRMREQIHAIVVQAFIEGAVNALDGFAPVKETQ